MKLYDYQIENAEKGLKILRVKKLVYLHFEVRTGKTLTSLEIAKGYEAKKVLFLTKKKAISSIIADYQNFEYFNYFDILVVNYESLHKIDFIPDLVILDEAHTLGAFPKPSQRTKLIKQKFSRLPMIMLSGTPSVESSSQWYHQMWVSVFSPFGHVNFYKWAKDFVNVEQRHLGYGVINDYSKGKDELINKALNGYVLTYTQSDAGFKTKVSKNIIECDLDPIISNLSKRLKKDNIIVGSKSNLTADTGAKLLNKLHQFSGGTVILDNNESINLDLTKANFIKDNFNEKIAIFYYFKQELNVLKEVYGDELTTDLDEFNTTSKVIALQQYSGAEGISLKAASKLIFYNWGLSGVKFIQSIDRMTTKDRLSNDVYFICGKGTISRNVLDRVLNKESYGIAQFKKDYRNEISN
jgi:hypothetical protein